MWYLKNRYFKEIHDVFQVTCADICNYYKGVLLKFVSIDFLHIYMLSYEQFADLHSLGKIVNIIHSYCSSPKDLHHS